MTSTAVTTMVMSRAVGLREADISVDVSFEDANGSRGFAAITGTFDYSPFIPVIMRTFNGGDIDFEQLAFDIVATTRMPVVQ